MADDGRVEIKITADNSQAKKTLRDTESDFKKLGKTAESESKRSTDKVKNDFKNMGDSIESNIENGMASLDRTFNKMATEATKDLNKVEDQGGKTANGLTTVMATAAVSIGNMITQMAMKMVDSIKRALASTFDLLVNFDDSMRQVQATLGLTGEEGAKAFKELEAAAREAGATTKFSATDAAEAINYLAQAGYDAAKAQEFLPSVMNLAAASGMSIADTANMLTNSVNALGLDAAQTQELIDKMAKSATASGTSVAELGQGILTIGSLASASNQDLTDLTTALGMMSDVGIKGAEGGTALRNMLLTLQSPSASASAELKKLGINILDAEGDMKSIVQIMGELNAATSDMSQAQKTASIAEIFNRYDIAAALGLMTQLDEKGTALYDEVLNNSEGAAGVMAETLEGGIGGVVREIESGVEEVMLSAGRGFEPVLKAILPSFQTILGILIPNIQKLMDTLSPVILESFAESGNKLMKAFQELAPVFFEWLEFILPPFIKALGIIAEGLATWLLPTLKIVIGFCKTLKTLLTPLVALFNLWTEYQKSALKELDKVWEWLIEKLDFLLPIFDTLKRTADSLAKAMGTEFEEVTETVDETDKAIADLKTQLEDLDGTDVNVNVNTNYTSSGSSGSSGSGFSSGGGSSSGGGGSSYADVVYAVEGISYGSNNGSVGYYNSKTGESVSEQTVKDKFNSKWGTNYHTGGIVPGSGEVNTKVLGGEMILTKQQQAGLFDLAVGDATPKSDSGNFNVGEFMTRLKTDLMDAINSAALNVTVDSVLNLDGETLARNLRRPLDKERSRFR